jgi:hypothetical protein
MMRGKRSLRDSQNPSPEGSEDDEARSPVSNDGDAGSLGLKTPPIVRGRKGKTNSSSGQEEAEREAMDVMH